jgi:hypothetical protein
MGNVNLRGRYPGLLPADCSYMLTWRSRRRMKLDGLIDIMSAYIAGRSTAVESASQLQSAYT